jgi:hypothetical protein
MGAVKKARKELPGNFKTGDGLSPWQSSAFAQR